MFGFGFAKNCQKCDTFSKSGGSCDRAIASVVASIGEVCNCRQKQGAVHVGRGAVFAGRGEVHAGSS